VTFECKLDSGSYKPCTTPKTYTRLKQGSHTVSVRAVDQDGHKDSTPAKQSFKI
jgi:large repetitive protein